MEYIPPKVWLPIALLTMLLNGSLSTIQNMTVQWAPDTSIMVFNFWAFLIGASLCWILLFIHKLRGGHLKRLLHSLRLLRWIYALRPFRIGWQHFNYVCAAICSLYHCLSS